MKIHPEMVETINKAMREGLRADSSKTPDKILSNVRRLAQAQQQVFHGKGALIAEKIYNCRCLSVCIDHVPWCDGSFRIEFKRDENSYPIHEQNGRHYLMGHSPWGGI